jgi:hypothetical protein
VVLVDAKREIREFLTSRRARITPEQAGLPVYGGTRRVLSTRSEEFRIRWAAHDVRVHQTGAKPFRHPVVGDLTLTFEMLELAADPGLNLLTYNAEVGSRSEQGLRLLASWAATLGALEPAGATRTPGLRLGPHAPARGYAD